MIDGLNLKVMKFTDVADDEETDLKALLAGANAATQSEGEYRHTV